MPTFNTRTQVPDEQVDQEPMVRWLPECQSILDQISFEKGAVHHKLAKQCVLHMLIEKGRGRVNWWHYTFWEVIGCAAGRPPFIISLDTLQP